MRKHRSQSQPLDVIVNVASSPKHCWGVSSVVYFTIQPLPNKQQAFYSATSILLCSDSLEHAAPSFPPEGIVGAKNEELAAEGGHKKNKVLKPQRDSAEQCNNQPKP